jgi:hypothetical protein
MAVKVSWFLREIDELMVHGLIGAMVQCSW